MAFSERHWFIIRRRRLEFQAAAPQRDQCRSENAIHLHSRMTPNDSDTGFPFLRTWRGVYTFVLAAFVLMVALLTVLTLAYS